MSKNAKEEKRRREAENMKLLKEILNTNSILAPLEPLKKAKEYLNIISRLEKCVKYFPESDKNSNYYKKYILKIEELLETIAEIYYSKEKYNECIDIDRKLLNYNDKNDKAMVRLYKCYWIIGDKEFAVIYGSFLYLRCDKKTQDKYKELIQEIKNNVKIVSNEFKNKSWYSDIKFTKKTCIQFIFFIICILFLLYNLKDLNTLI